MDVIIDRIEVYADGRFVGEVDRIPEDLARVRGTVHRGGGIMFDRDLFIVGDPHVGFEIISTRHYDDFVLNGYRRSHGYRAGVLDFRRERVLKIRHSRFFDPFDFTGFVPIDLLPRDREWIGDYGYGAPSRHWYGDDDRTYYGYLDDVDDFDRIGGDRAQYEEVPPGVRGAVRLPEVDPLERSDDESFRTESGAEIRVKREATLERVD